MTVNDETDKLGSFVKLKPNEYNSTSLLETYELKFVI